MRVTVALSVFLVVVIGFAVAYPSWEKIRGDVILQKPHHHEQDVGEGLYPSPSGVSGRRRPVSTRRSANPVYVVRSPRYFSSDDDSYLSPYARRYNVFRSQFRGQKRDDEEEDDDDESAEDDEDNDEPEDDEFNTPTWDEMFPREETGPHGQNQGSYGGDAIQSDFGGQNQPQYDLGVSGPPQIQQGGGGDLLGFEGHNGANGAGGLPGGPQGRSGGARYHSRQVRPVTVRIMKPRQYDMGSVSVQKPNRWVVYQPQQQSHRQYYGRRHAQPGQSYSYASGPVRRWAYQPVQQQKPQYVYYQPGRVQVRQPSRARYVLGQQKQSWSGRRSSRGHVQANKWGYY